MSGVKKIRVREVVQATLIPLVLLAAGVAWSKAQSAHGDREFVAEASSGGTAEVILGELARQKGTNATVRNFGQKMASDHTEANRKLQVAAGQESREISSDLTPEDRATYEKLSKLSDAAFDRAYAADMVKDHEQDIAAFEKEAKSGKDPLVRQFAEQALPTLRGHLQMAQEMARTVGANSASGM